MKITFVQTPGCFSQYVPSANQFSSVLKFIIIGSIILDLITLHIMYNNIYTYCNICTYCNVHVVVYYFHGKLKQN